MNRQWDIYMVGTLAEEKEIDGGIWRDSVFINSYNSLQFYIKVISDQPDNFPNVKYFTGYTSDIQYLQFEDDITLTNEERILELKKFFSSNLLIFKPLQKGENFGVRDVVQARKPNNYNNTSTYIPVPLFTVSDFHRTFDDFFNLLSKKEFIDEVYGISNEQSDTPSIVVWEDEKYTNILGSFIGHTYSRGKIKFEFDVLKYKEFNRDWYINIIRNLEIKNILFVGRDVYTKMEQEIEFYTNKPEEKMLKEEDERYKLKEVNFINNFFKHTKEVGLTYDECDLINFHTAMKSSNLVILSGMSGSGKSKLVQMYGESLGLTSSQLNIIPVRSAWCDDRDLLGYVDSIHNVYKPGDSGLIDTLIEANDNIDKLYIICFDEMNLARVEYYFSQFLSILERDEINRKIKLYNRDLEYQLYNANKYKCEIPIMDNVLFVGTVNIDESTYHFSDKVLDRANVITLNIQDFRKLKHVKIEKKVKYNEIMYNEYRRYISTQLEVELNDVEIELLSILHKELNRANRNIGIGFRIVKQIDVYLKNIPDNKILTRQDAFDLQIVQRVLTKIRGPQEQIENLIGIYNSQDESVSDSIIINLLDKYNEISHFKITRNCIKEKAKELKIYGYSI